MRAVAKPLRANRARAIRPVVIANGNAAVACVTKFDAPGWKWDNGVPDEYAIENDGNSITITPRVGLDYWSKTFYSPLLVKHDAQCLLHEVSCDDEATITTAFTVAPRAQFDQDHTPRLALRTLKHSVLFVAFVGRYYGALRFLDVGQGWH